MVNVAVFHDSFHNKEFRIVVPQFVIVPNLIKYMLPSDYIFTRIENVID